MIRFSVETEIARPPAAVYAYVTDPAKLPTWQTNTTAVAVEGGPPLALGSRLRETHRAPGGRELESLVEVTALDRDRRFALRMLDGPLPLDADLRFHPSGAGTVLTFTVHGTPRGALRLAQPLLRAALKRQFRSHLRTLKAVLESGSALP